VSLAGKTLGVYGFGRIGRAVAKRAEAFGMIVRPYDQGGSESELREFLSKVDVLSIHAPLTEETRGRFGEREFLRMKEGSIVVNTARGPIVDEKALAAALHSKHLFGAGLDVFQREPEIEAALLGLSNVVLLPHLGSATTETRLAMARLACTEIVRFFAGEPPLNPVP
jgi:glyoxylate reductase